MSQKEVCGLEIAMNHSEGVRFGKRLGGLEQVIDRQLERDAPLLFEQLLEVLPLQVLHDHVRSAARQRGHVENAHHVFASNLDRRSPLAEKPCNERRIVRELGEQELDRDSLLELQVHCCEDDPHPPLAEHALDAVLLREHVIGSRNEVCVGHGAWEELPKAKNNITAKLPLATDELNRPLARAVSLSRVHLPTPGSPSPSSGASSSARRMKTRSTRFSSAER